MKKSDIYQLYAEKIANIIAEFGIEDKEAWIRIIKQIHCSLAKDQKAPAVGGEVWKVYADVYKDRYKIEIKHSAKNYALCKTLAGYIGLEESKELIRYYLTVNDQWTIKQGHPLSALVANYQRFYNEMLGHGGSETRARMAQSSSAVSDYLRERNNANK